MLISCNSFYHCFRLFLVAFPSTSSKWFLCGTPRSAKSTAKETGWSRNQWLNLSQRLPLLTSRQRIRAKTWEDFLYLLLCFFSFTAVDVETYDCGPNNPCTAENAQNGKFYFPYSDPSKFVQCGQWGQCHIMPCPRGLNWDQTTLQCLPYAAPKGPASSKRQPDASAKNAKRGKLPVKSRGRRRA